MKNYRKGFFHNGESVLRNISGLVRNSEYLRLEIYFPT
jgi:hypothetical protein